MKIAIATCPEKPQGTKDDELLTNALKARGHEAVNCVWSDRGVDWAQFDQCVLRSPWDYYKRLGEFLRWAEQISHRTQLVNPFETVRTNSHKSYLVEWEKAGFPVVPSFISLEQKETEAKCRELLRQGPVVLKPAVSGGSYLTHKIESKSGLNQLVESVLAHGDALVQPFLPSVAEEGEVSLIYFRVGREWKYSHTVLKTAVSGDYRVQSNFGGKVDAITPPTSNFALAEKILPRLDPHDLYVRIDLVDWRNDPKIGELELIEPALFFEFGEKSANLCVDALELSVTR